MGAADHHHHHHHHPFDCVPLVSLAGKCTHPLPTNRHGIQHCDRLPCMFGSLQAPEHMLLAAWHSYETPLPLCSPPRALKNPLYCAAPYKLHNTCSWLRGTATEHLLQCAALLKL
eukprot:1161734-Pelagomonas_calceolata.AAC.15